ncbi:Pisatin demethylase [Fusarium albosuccineum]|uniref:Pisatin demethylase n=1 Tax=Fusarium albosuccineum TaxID=1237068 RepID=A0A8H4L6H1_9HYPO|nr:Pisatin demethylase [Fusarium albosuccineum]
MALLKDLESSLSSGLIAQHLDLAELRDVSPKDLAVGFLLIIAIFLTGFYLVPLVQSFLFSPLRRIPGPLLARVTRWWEYRLVTKGDSNLQYIRLHKKYGECIPPIAFFQLTDEIYSGPVVRVGPNRYSVSQPKDVKAIYELGGKFTKSDYYKPLLNPKPDEQNIFPIQDNERHKERRRRISPLYTMSSMVSYEPAVDGMTNVCIRKLYQFAEEGRLIDIPHWMQYYAFDVIGEITFNKSFNMMENEGDTSGMIPGIREANDFLAFLGVVPNLVPWVLGLSAALGRKSNTSVLVSYTFGQINKNREANAHSTTKDTKKYDTFLKKVLDMEAEGRLKLPNVLDACGSNIGAGSDTTAVTLSSALYYLYSNPVKLEKLRQEIDSKATDGSISDPVTFQEAQNMTYLQAVMKESLRLHPAVGTILPRVVPRGGMELSGHYFPEGTEVGVNAWVLHYSKDIYGPDPQVFRPERWIGDEKTSIMGSMMFAFGAGSRTCIGRNISLLEMTKVIPQIVRKFDLVLEHPGKPMDTTCAWFVYPHYNGRFKVRGTKTSA